MAGQHVAPGEGSLADLAEVGSAASTDTRVRGARLKTSTVNSSGQIKYQFISFRDCFISSLDSLQHTNPPFLDSR